MDALPLGFFALSFFTGFHGLPKNQSNGGLQLTGTVLALKEESMRRNAIRLLVAAVLLVSGNLMQLHAATSPLPVPSLPPVYSN